MKLVYVASEVYPFIKTGGLADVAGTLPKYIAREGIKTSVFLPLYKSIDRDKFGIKKTEIEFDINLNNRNYRFTVYKLKDDIKYIFLHNSEFFDREFPYGTPDGDYPDNDLRFGAFSYAVFEAMKRMGYNPDIIHLNDWQTALIPVLLKEKYSYQFPNTKTVITIHNIAYQGIFDKFAIERLNLGWHLYHMEALEYWGNINFLKGGLVFSDAITTVSPTYAKEICTPEYGYGLDGVLRKYYHKLYGILNGIDYTIWNPSKDPYIYQNFCYRTAEKKYINKIGFYGEFGLKNPEKPLFIFIGRFAKQKGIDLIIDLIEEFKNSEALNLAILGFGDKDYNNYFNEIKGKYSNVFVEVKYDEILSRKMYASADFLLMPSLFEPCGLNQMIAMRYLTLVVARRTGGLADTVKDINERNGYGILFEKPEKNDFLVAVNRALNLYNNKKDLFKELQKQVGKLDFSWEVSAQKYIRLYETERYG